MGQRGRPRYPDVLTPREQDILALIRDGLTNEQIAERLNIGFETAKSHVAEILSKLGVATREEAAAWQPQERRAWWSAVWRWVLAGTAATALGALALLALGVWLTGSADTPASAPGWPNCPPVEAQAFASGIYVLDGGTCQIQTIDGTGMMDGSPVWSQDGRQIAFVGQGEIFVADTETGDVTQITHSPTAVKDSIAWTPDGGLVFSSVDTAKPGNNVTQLNYDLMFAPRGQKPRVVASGRGCPGISISSLGKVAVYIGCSTDAHVALVDLDTGSMTTIVSGVTYGASWSPDGQSLLYTCPATANSGPAPSCVKRGDQEPQPITSSMFPPPDFVPADVAPAFWGQDGSIWLIDANDTRAYVLPAGATVGSVYAAVPGLSPLNVHWASNSVISFDRCQAPELPPGTASIGPCPDEQTVSAKVATGEEKIIVDAHCATLTEWSPSGRTLAIVVPAHPACGV
jgi:DNA-binding CsgD family transcriptional regulator/dipeptidyl aminopeptidase/acylaminoacyl peptidase